MAEYEVRLPPSKMCLKITKGMKKSSEKIGALITGDIVEVFAVVGDRANICRPIAGWCSMKNDEKNLKYLYKTRKEVRQAADTTCHMTKMALDHSRKDYCWENISILERHIQVIRNQRELSGHADVMKATMKELQARKGMFEELLNPKLEWNCTACTYLNSPIYFECQLCNTRKPAEITVAMSAKLQALLCKQVDEEKEIARMFSSVKDEKPVTQIDRLQTKVTELLDQHSEVSHRIEELEESNMTLTNKISEMETTLKTCVNLDAVDPKDWSVAMVSTWLLQLGIKQYQEDFEDASIDGESLLSLDDIKLEKLDVRRRHRPLILNAIAELQKTHEKFNSRKMQSSHGSGWETSAVFESPKARGLCLDEDNFDEQLSRKPIEDSRQPSDISPLQKCAESKDDFAVISDEEWDNAADWDIVGEEI